MPELPEVETIARGVDSRVRGRTILSVWLGSKPEPFRSTPAEIAATLTGSTIERVHRVGKHIVVDLSRKHSGSTTAQWLVHLGMTGRLLVYAPDVPLAPHTHAILQLDDHREIRFVDPRRFGRLSVLDLSAPATKTSGKTTG
ncbi:MAG: DNA-formamidopyrimidine glycosylase family protein, partial [Acidobacteriaceae bacterium]